MKTSKILLAFLFSFSFGSIFAQGLTVSGTIQCTEGLPVGIDGSPYIMYYEGATGFLTDSIAIPVNPNGSFFATIEPNATQGSVYLFFMDAAGNNQVATATYSPMDMNLVFTLDGCAEVATCDASFSIFQDPNDPNSGNVYVVSDATGDNLTYSWSFGDGSSGNGFSASHFYSEMGTYTLCLTIAASDGCTDEYCDTFTMNGDSTFIDGPGMMLQGFTLLINQIQNQVDEIDNVNLNVFPNPVNSNGSISLNISNPFVGMVKIIDVNGREVNSFRLNAAKGISQLPVGASELNAGVYQMILKSDKGEIHTVKFVRQ